jgi:hypothetical protein
MAVSRPKSRHSCLSYRIPLRKKVWVAKRNRLQVVASAGPADVIPRYAVLVANSELDFCSAVFKRLIHCQRVGLFSLWQSSQRGPQYLRAAALLRLRLPTGFALQDPCLARSSIRGINTRKNTHFKKKIWKSVCSCGRGTRI